MVTNFAFARHFQRVLRGEPEPPPRPPKEPEWKRYGKKFQDGSYEIGIPKDAMFTKSEITEHLNTYTQRKHMGMWRMLQKLSEATWEGTASRDHGWYKVPDIMVEHIKLLEQFLESQARVNKVGIRREEMICTALMLHKLLEENGDY